MSEGGKRLKIIKKERKKRQRNAAAFCVSMNLDEFEGIVKFLAIILLQSIATCKHSYADFDYFIFMAQFVVKK